MHFDPLATFIGSIAGDFMADKQVNQGQVVWAVALILAGLGVFYRLPQVMPKIEAIPQFAAASGIIRFCFYFMGLFLIGGGCKKLYQQYRK
ncbi:hypothetical protein [Desulfosarcina cetonica]|uniref:hypothetical protein n=1 Tax=Desulfosarcina cetonica TaxID=90730 RepID=UPI0006D05681|nr:hypothetical protein [Desulfosarcina cetonica]